MSRADDFEHISLVMTPGRKGTNVSYNFRQDLPLIFRPNNNTIKNHIFGYASIYLSESDRKKYLNDCNKSSLLPNDNYFLKANRIINMEEKETAYEHIVVPEIEKGAFGIIFTRYQCYSGTDIIFKIAKYFRCRFKS